MKVLVVGKGGREHALCWKLRQSPRVQAVYCAPGNAGTALEAINIEIEAHEIDRLVRFARQEGIALTVVGPEEPLALGIVDAFEKEGLRIVGPTKAAAELEASKVFAKEFMRQFDIPTAEFRVFDDPDLAKKYIETRDHPVVVKADGLAGGKGVIVCSTKEEALAAVDKIMVEQAFGLAGRRIVIERRLEGQELSVFALVSGRTIVMLEPVQDHKPAFDEDRGPNTGGMGAFSPTPIETPELMREIQRSILVPAVHGMRYSRRPFRGILYAGLMVTPQGPRVLEFNVRLGDPETQPLMMRLQTDLCALLEAVAYDKLEAFADTGLQWDPRPAVCVVLASEGYPGPYQKGRTIFGLERAAQLPDVKVFHSGTRFSDGRIVTDGGRVLAVTALGENLLEAKRRAYEAVKCIEFAGMFYRRDIADRAIRRLRLQQPPRELGPQTP
ncbi:MAG: phosphoribosylamine--glycine ligase [Gemmatales bacterium]|nr:phosphoribosylamine--glycine ligase [Gemmatales bacterium]MDW7993612.1 phosphoribosylamine--glycine ligase [Gemmatales bacterium]